MSDQRLRHGTLSGKQKQSYRSTNRASIAALQTSDIRQMNHNGKQQAIGDDIELRVRARNKSAT
jgi:hypothetical protein